MINYGHLFSHASSTFLVGWQQTWSHENLRTRGNISGKGSTASFEIMLCDLDIQPSLLGTVRAPKYGYFVHRWTSQHGNFHGWRMVEGQFKSLDFWQPIFDKQKTMRVCIYMFFFVCMCVSHICHLLDIFPTNHCLQAVYRWFLSEELEVTIAPNRTKPIRVLWWHPTNYHYIYHSHKSESHTAWNTLACLIFWQGSCSSILLFIDCHI
jgi:hypothetical protein